MHDSNTHHRAATVYVRHWARVKGVAGREQLRLSNVRLVPAKIWNAGCDIHAATQNFIK
jgi:hypothetical protein